jgi:hypothetical protein
MEGIIQPQVARVGKRMTYPNSGACGSALQRNLPRRKTKTRAAVGDEDANIVFAGPVRKLQAGGLLVAVDVEGAEVETDWVEGEIWRKKLSQIQNQIKTRRNLLVKTMCSSVLRVATHSQKAPLFL